MTGFGVDYHMPRPPFIIPKLLWRHGLSVIFSPVWLALQFIVRVFAGIFGFSAGIFGHPSDRFGAEADFYPPEWKFEPGILKEDEVL